MIDLLRSMYLRIRLFTKQQKTGEALKKSDR
jgi:hypothetical protein